MSEMSIPTAEELFDRPYPEAPPPPAAWVGDSVAVALTNRECARLLVNCIFDPPITEEEIRSYAGRFQLADREAEIEIRRRRYAAN